MSSMADLFMQYFETKEGSRFHKKGQMMEMQLSRFISEGFLPSEGTEMAERRNGRMWSENILQSKRQQEEERKRKVLEKRQTLQEMEYVKMITEEQEGISSQNQDYPAATEKETDPVPVNPDSLRLCGTQDSVHRSDPMTLSLRDSRSDSGDPRQEPSLENYVPVVHPLQPGLIEMVPLASAKERISSLNSMSAALTTRASVPKEDRGMVERLEQTAASPRLSGGPLPEVKATPTSPEDRSEDAALETNASSSISGTIATYSRRASTTAATSVLSLASNQRRSKYEETASMEPHLRAMFARAATVIKNTIDCDVVFVHGDLEGFFEPETAEGGQHLDDWGWSHVSSDDKSESKARAKRPKQHRQRSGILGYATSKGSSSVRFDGPKNITDLGFDMSELREEHLAFLLKDSEGGKIFSFFDEYPGLEEHEDPEEIECKKMLQKFLPGCRSVIVVPLHDHNQRLSSVCFAWTCSDQKTFYGDEEGRFAHGVATSLMDEMARIQILSGMSADLLCFSFKSILTCNSGQGKKRVHL